MAAAALVVVAATAVGCGGGSAPSGGGTSPSMQISIDEKANGTTVHGLFGGQLTVTLHSTYWSLSLPSNGHVLQPVYPAATAPATTCPHAVPGSGCGTVAATYNFGHVGTATLHAHRTSCGEALRCTGKDADWSITVVVS